MVHRGRVKNGVVVLDGLVTLPEGAEVAVRLLEGKRSATKAKRRSLTLAERLAPFIGKAKHLAPDASINLDHYLYGLPKRE